jgi:hypothetical protein
MSAFLEVGAIVRLDACPDWGLGQIQSVVGARVTVTFEHAGKVVIDTASANLTVVNHDWL